MAWERGAWCSTCPWTEPPALPKMVEPAPKGGSTCPPHAFSSICHRCSWISSDVHRCSWLLMDVHGFSRMFIVSGRAGGREAREGRGRACVHIPFVSNKNGDGWRRVGLGYLRVTHGSGHFSRHVAKNEFSRSRSLKTLLSFAPRRSETSFYMHHDTVHSLVGWRAGWHAGWLFYSDFAGLGWWNFTGTVRWLYWWRWWIQF